MDFLMSCACTHACFWPSFMTTVILHVTYSENCMSTEGFDSVLHSFICLIFFILTIWTISVMFSQSITVALNMKVTNTYACLTHMLWLYTAALMHMCLLWLWTEHKAAGVIGFSKGVAYHSRQQECAISASARGLFSVLLATKRAATATMKLSLVW